ncbi:MAG: pre-toxin TG domain-containing protein [Deinococcaceae bacterium]
MGNTDPLGFGSCPGGAYTCGSDQIYTPSTLKERQEEDRLRQRNRLDNASPPPDAPIRPKAFEDNQNAALTKFGFDTLDSTYYMDKIIELIGKIDDPGMRMFFRHQVMQDMQSTKGTTPSNYILRLSEQCEKVLRGPNRDSSSATMALIQTMDVLSNGGWATSDNPVLSGLHDVAQTNRNNVLHPNLTLDVDELKRIGRELLGFNDIYRTIYGQDPETGSDIPVWQRVISGIGVLGYVNVVGKGASLIAKEAKLLSSIEIRGLSNAKGMRSTSGGFEVTRKVTEEDIRRSLQNASVKPSQKAISLPVVQNYVERLNKGEIPPNITVDNGILVEGHHRYVASLIVGKEIGTSPGTLSMSRLLNPINWKDLRIDPIDWGNR